MNAHASDIFTVHEGDARRMGALLDQLGKPNDPPLTCTITSPPYGALKNYGGVDQIGWGQPYDEYLVEMRRLFRSLYQYTKLDGSMWVIADTLRADDSGRGDLPQRLEPLPFQLMQEAAEAGWILRETLIWQKQKTLPWSSGRRLRNVFEYVLLFVKSSQYKFHVDRLRDVENLEEWWVKWPERYNPNGKVPTNVWEIPIPQQGTWGSSAVQHACPLPPDLIERLIFLSTDEGDVVFDPFAGSGVVVAEAQRLGRSGIGIELNRHSVKAYRKFIQPEIMRRDENDAVKDRMDRAEDMRGRVIRLRAMKYPKLLWQRFSKESELPTPLFVLTIMGKIRSNTMSDVNSPLPVKVVFAYNDEVDAEILESVQRRLKDIANRPPATKFGIAGNAVVVRLSDLPLHLRREKLFLYERGRTWDAVREIRPRELADLRPAEATRRGAYAYPPMIGNVEVHETPGAKS